MRNFKKITPVALFPVLGPLYSIGVLSHQLINPEEVFHFQHFFLWLAFHLVSAFTFRAYLTVQQFKSAALLFFLSLVVCGMGIMLIYQQPQYCLKGGCSGPLLPKLLFGGLAWGVFEMAVFYSTCIPVGWVLEKLPGFKADSKEQ